MNVGIYARLSREDENDSIQNQLGTIQSFVQKIEGSIVATYIDNGESSFSLDREAMSKAMYDMSQGKIDILAIKDLDRFTRSMRDWYYLCDVLRENKVQLISVNEGIIKLDKNDPYGDIGTRIKMVVNEEELLKTIRKMREGRKQKAKRGYSISTNTIMGYDKKNKNELTINEDEATIVRLIYDKYIEYGSFIKVAKHLNSLGLKTKRGANYSHHSVRYILTNPLYIGKVRYGVRENTEEAFIVEGNHEPIISEETFEKVQKLIPKRQRFRESKYNDIIFTNLYCAKCGGKVYSHGTATTNKYGKKYRTVRYYCYNAQFKDVCDAGMITQNKLEKSFLNYLEDQSMATKVTLESNNNLTHQKEVIEKKIKDIDKKIENLVDLRISGTIEKDLYEKKSRELNNEKSELLEGLEVIIGEIEKTENKEKTREIAGVFKENYVQLEVEDRHEYIREFVDAIYIDVTKEKRYNEINVKSIIFS